MKRMNDGSRVECHRVIVSLLLMLLGFCASWRAQAQNAESRIEIAKPASATPGSPHFALAKKTDGEPRLAAGAGTSVPVAAQPGISAALGRDDSRYHVRAVRGGFRAENPQQGLAAEFTARGIEVHTRAARWRLALQAYGYGDNLRKVAVAAPQASANCVEDRRGALTEWYVNGPVGLEQGFTLERRPGQDNGQPLTIALHLSTDSLPSLDSDGKGLTLTHHDGRASLRYAGLLAYDAAGKEMRSWLELRGHDLLLHVKDTDAQYPLVVDPFFQLAKLTTSDGAAFDEFGFSVAASGDGGTVVVGALQALTTQGAAYVFVKSRTGWATTSAFTAKLTASDGVANDHFGNSVAISSDGGTVVVGAFTAMLGANILQGASYVFVKPGTGWTTTTESAKLTASDGAAFDEFGSSVAASGDGGAVAVGAPFAKIGSNLNQGAAYVFVKAGTGWVTMTETAKLTASDGAASDEFGSSLAMSGDGGTVVVGAPFATIGSNSSQGAAYVFVEPLNGWTTTSGFTAKLTASDGAAFDALGLSTVISGDGATVVAGAPNATFPSSIAQGVAYVFTKPGNGWATTSTFTAKLTASDGAPFNFFGASLALSRDGGIVAIGTPGATIGSNSNQGAAYVFVEPMTGWATTSTFTAKLTASDGAAFDSFGISVAISDDGGTVVTGALFAKIGSNSNQGAAYMFGVTVTVAIDIKPGDDPPSINPKSHGEIPVAILSSSTFDATTLVDRTSLTFGHTGEEQSLAFCNPGGEDVNGDGLLDLVCHFSTPKTGFHTGDTVGVLKGKTVTGTPIRGTDSIRIVP